MQYIHQGDFRKLINSSFWHHIAFDNNILTITDPPYNQGYHYNSYNDDLKTEEYIELLSYIPKPCIIIHYPEETINILPKSFKSNCDEIITWVYNSNTGKQSRLISFWGCKPDFKLLRQPYKNPNDKRIKERIARGLTGCKSYDWFNINQVKNVSKQKTEHPCQIPEELIDKILTLMSYQKWVYFDPFAGSGTLAKVCEKRGENSLNVEIDEKYFNIIKSRVEKWEEVKV
jgi:DNA modification methylase